MPFRFLPNSGSFPGAVLFMPSSVGQSVLILLALISLEVKPSFGSERQRRAPPLTLTLFLKSVAAMAENGIPECQRRAGSPPHILLIVICMVILHGQLRLLTNLLDEPLYLVR